MKEDRDEIRIDSDIINGTYSTFAPKVTMNSARFLFRDCTLFLVFRIFLFFFVAGVVTFVWLKILGGALIAIALLLAATVWRYLSLRKIEFKNAVLTPGVVIAQRPPTVLVLANLACDGRKTPVLGLKVEDCRSLEPLSAEIGTRIPCVTAFLGSGLGGCWDKMVSNPLTSGTGDRQLLGQALSRLDDEDDWRILNEAVEQKNIPTLGKTLRLPPTPPPLPRGEPTAD
jgi:hypothetical protein